MVFTKSQLIVITKHLRELANVFESASVAQQSEKSKRGRKPGSVADELRCKGEIVKGDRCKNRAINNGMCGKHTI